MGTVFDILIFIFSHEAGNGMEDVRWKLKSKRIIVYLQCICSYSWQSSPRWLWLFVVTDRWRLSGDHGMILFDFPGDF